MRKQQRDRGKIGGPPPEKSLFLWRRLDGEKLRWLKNWPSLLVLMQLMACAASPPPTPSAQTVEEQRCIDSARPDAASCTAIIQGGQATQLVLAKAFAARGSTYQRGGQTKLAIDDYSQALRLGLPRVKERFYVLQARGSAYEGIGEHQRAVDDYDHAIQLDLDVPGTYFLRGTAPRALGQNDRAAADFAKCRELTALKGLTNAMGC
jgi:tetratricopeptide (TPR) repeat protein